MKTHCMVDLETLGTSAGSVITAIGAVTFTQAEILQHFYMNVSIDSCLNMGMVVDGGSIKFWLLHASDQNRRDLFDPQPRGIREALTAFTTFFQLNNCNWLWSHGSNFDIPALDAAYKATGHGKYVPWSYRLTRDTRTLYSLLPAFNSVVVAPLQSNKHNALADAEYQAQCVIKAYEVLGKEMET